jgi:hypothetical protein
MPNGESGPGVKGLVRRPLAGLVPGVDTCIKRQSKSDGIGSMLGKQQFGKHFMMNVVIGELL